jgi:HEAT repeat protein
MTTQFARMDALMRPGTTVAQLCDALADDDWQVRYTAAVALGDRADAGAIDTLLAALMREDAAPLYAQPREFASLPAGGNARPVCDFPAGTTQETLDAWHRRGRVKQAIVTTLGLIGAADPRVLAVLQRYAVDQAEDYAVRAAANKALGLIGDPSALAAVTQATADQEWCTRCEATKALARLLG